MSTLDQIHKSIEAHIAEIHREIAALEAARAALQEDGAGVPEPSAPKRRRLRVAKAANGNGAATGDAVSGNGKTPAVDRPRRRARRKSAAAAKPVEVLLSGKLEAMLRESEDGLSAITISKRSNAGYRQVLELLRELESAGQLRRSGTRRTSLWRVITDEERIAERAAELEALSAAKSGAAPGA